MPQTKAGASFEKTRKALLVGLSARSKGKETEKVIRFGNKDVPSFLRKLDRFEARSRQVSVVVS